MSSFAKTKRNNCTQESVPFGVGDGVIHLSEMVEILQKRGDEPLDDCEVTVKIIVHKRHLGRLYSSRDAKLSTFRVIGSFD